MAEGQEDPQVPSWGTLVLSHSRRHGTELLIPLAGVTTPPGISGLAPKPAPLGASGPAGDITPARGHRCGDGTGRTA